MDTYRTDEEQVEALKQWWKDNGLSVVAGLVLGVAAIVGVRYWFDYQKNQAQQASLAYEQMQTAITAQDNTQVEASAEQLMQDYASTSYASLAALAIAKIQVEANELGAAQSHLQWIIDNSSEDDFRHIARQRLARVLLAEKKYDLALALINGIEQASYTSIYEEIRGDIFLAQGNPTQAREKYRRALAGVEQDPQRRRLLEMKLNDLVVEIKAEAQP